MKHYAAAVPLVLSQMLIMASWCLQVIFQIPIAVSPGPLDPASCLLEVPSTTAAGNYVS